MLSCQYENHLDQEIKGVCLDKKCKKNRISCTKCLRDFHRDHNSFLMLDELKEYRQNNYSFMRDLLQLIDCLREQAIYLIKCLSEQQVNLNESLDTKNQTELNLEIQKLLIISEIKSIDFQHIQIMTQQLQNNRETIQKIKQSCQYVQTRKITQVNTNQILQEMHKLSSVLFTETIYKVTLSDKSKLIQSLQFTQDQNLKHIIESQNYFYLSEICIGLILQFDSIFQSLNQDLIKGDYKKWDMVLKCLLIQMKNLNYVSGTFFTRINTNIQQKEGEVIQINELFKLSEKQQEQQNLKLIVNSAKQYVNLYYLLPYQSFVIKSKQQNLIVLREIPQPRSNQMILWITQTLKQDYKLIETVEQQNPQITFMFCIQNQDLKDLFSRYQWLKNLDQQYLRIVLKQDTILEELKLLYEVINYQYKCIIYGTNIQQIQNTQNLNDKMIYVSEQKQIIDILSFKNMD